MRSIEYKPARPQGRNGFAAATLFAGLLVAVLATACAGETPPGDSDEVLPVVSVIRTEARDIAVRREFPARLHGAREVEVRARVPGILEQRLYREGATVRRGQPLFRIDPAQFEAALAVAQGEEREVQAEYRQARREHERVLPLFEQGLASARERDQVITALEHAEARLWLAAAAVEQARIDLGYTQVEAPLDGITSLEVLPEGSLVDRYTHLTTIVQQHPVHARFALPETEAALWRAGSWRASGPAGARLLLSDGREFDGGEVDFTASTIDGATGTLTLRAVFPNQDGQLLPGQFVRVQVVLMEVADAVIVPEAALRIVREGAEVWLVEDGRISVRPVRTGLRVAEGIIVTEGLAGAEQLVVAGPAWLTDGTAVTVSLDTGAWR